MRRLGCAATFALTTLTAAMVFAGEDVGPDLICGDIQSTRWWATDDVETAYSLGRTACNIGDVAANWAANPNHDHPISGGNLFRLSADGRFEQLGYQWVFHHFCAIQLNVCGSCNGGGGCQSVLHPDCSNPNTGSSGGGQTGLAPKWQVNPHTGEFVLPWHQGEGTSGSFRRRLRVRNEDLEPKLNPDARYFAEQFYLAKDDAAAGNANNNSSYREAAVTPGKSSFFLSFIDTIQRERAAMHAWAAADPDVTLVNVQVDADGERDPDTGLYDDGLMIVGHRVTESGDSTWRYEYAIQNLTAHRAARTFSVPVPDDVTVTDIGFHDVDYHSGDGIDGENFDGTDWPGVHVDGEVRWVTDTFEANENANALRWGTLYNFRFTADAPPTLVRARIGLYRPGDPGSMEVVAAAPTFCVADLDGSGAVDFGDVLVVLSAWGACAPPCVEDLDGSGAVDFGDILVVLGAWGEC